MTNESTDYAELISELIHAERPLTTAAADAIETLVRERDFAVEGVKRHVAALQAAERERDEARAERDKLFAENASIGNELFVGHTDLVLRAEAAEAEVVKLKAALMGLLDEPKNITKADLEFFEYCRVTTKAVLAARAALGGQA